MTTFYKKNAYFAKVIKELNVIEISFSRNPYRNSPKGILHSTKKSKKLLFGVFFGQKMLFCGRRLGGVDIPREGVDIHLHPPSKSIF